ncbi:hypothetical protein GCM10027059_27640 [Myceligenerans halotolerans]
MRAGRVDKGHPPHGVHPVDALGYRLQCPFTLARERAQLRGAVTHAPLEPVTQRIVVQDDQDLADDDGNDQTSGKRERPTTPSRRAVM